MRKINSRHPAEIDPSFDGRIHEIAHELLRLSRRLPVRLAGRGAFLQSVALILQREHRLVNSLKSAVGQYDRLLESMLESMDNTLQPPPLVIEVPFEPQEVQTASAEF